jgi:hypothetical protein
MATRLYLQNSAAGYTPTTYHGGWITSSGTIVTQAMQTTKLGTVVGPTPATPPHPTGTGSTILGRFVSDPLSANTTIGGSGNTFSWSATLGNVLSFFSLFPAVYIWVTQGDTNTARGVPLALHSSTTVIPGSAGTGGGSTDSTTIALTSVSALAGDRIVVEIGFSYTGANNGAYMWYGGTGSDQTAGSSSTTLAGWIQFSQTITFGAAPITIAIPLISDTHTANSFTVAKTYPLDIASRVNYSAYQLAVKKTIVLASPTNTLTAYAITLHKSGAPIVLVLISYTTTAYGFTILKTILLSAAISIINTAYTFTIIKTHLLTIAAQVINTAYPLTRLKTHVLASPNVVTTAHSFTVIKTYLLTSPSYSTTAYQILVDLPEMIPIPLISVTNTAYPITLVKVFQPWILTWWFKVRGSQPAIKWSEQRGLQ